MLRTAMALALVTTLAACASEPPPPPPPEPKRVEAPKPPPPPPPPTPAKPARHVPEHESDIARTFDQAIVALPGRGGGQSMVAKMDTPALRARLAAERGRRYPTVLFMHGCDGPRNLQALRAMARRGFAVIAPDSFARRFRPRQCDRRTRRGGRNYYVFDFRSAEISYALTRFRDLAWVDKKKFFLVGVSEGGLAAAQHRGSAFRARVISAWTCHGSDLVNGLGAPADEPVLALVHAKDPWYTRGRSRRLSGDCGKFFGLGRPRSRSIIIREGTRHDVLSDPKAMPRNLRFLEDEARRAGYTGV